MIWCECHSGDVRKGTSVDSYKFVRRIDSHPFLHAFFQFNPIFRVKSFSPIFLVQFLFAKGVGDECSFTFKHHCRLHRLIQYRVVSHLWCKYLQCWENELRKCRKSIMKKRFLSKYELMGKKIEFQRIWKQQMNERSFITNKRLRNPLSFDFLFLDEPFHSLL